MSYDIFGRFGYKAGTSGSPTIPKGAQIIGVWCQGTSSPSLTINGGDSIAFTTEFSIRFTHLLLKAESTTPLAFTNTTSYFVEYIVADMNAAASFG